MNQLNTDSAAFRCKCKLFHQNMGPLVIALGGMGCIKHNSAVHDGRMANWVWPAGSNVRRHMFHHVFFFNHSGRVLTSQGGRPQTRARECISMRTRGDNRARKWGVKIKILFQPKNHRTRVRLDAPNVRSIPTHGWKWSKLAFSVKLNRFRKVDGFPYKVVRTIRPKNVSNYDVPQVRV